MEIQIQILEKDGELVVSPTNITFPPAVGGMENKYELIVKNSTEWDIADFNINFGHENITVNTPTEIKAGDTSRGTVIYKASKKLQPDIQLQVLVSMSASQVR